MAENRVRYICPICDQELGLFKHFCWDCRRYIAEPWRFTGGHLPNEGHDGCHPAQTYMRPRTDGTPVRTSGSKSLAGKNNASKQYTYNRPGQSGTSTGRSGSYQSQRTYQNQRSYGDSNNPNTPRKKNTGIGSLFFVGFLFYFLIQVLLAFFRW
ncbi:MAG: hypothetical protein J6I64_06085 [Lachnospiraceae bacterium]|nr:hypothetical protein [Lachnospiraceae bacterium]